MAGDTFSTYYGEFLVSPIPIELSFNWCSHACKYCFANLNQPQRKANVQSTLNLLRDRYKRKSFEAFLLREQYPVLVSNRVDPFAVSNYRQVLPVLRLMSELEIPIALQTKGGRGIDEALEFLPKSCWYISLATLNDEHRQQMEPGAPSISERLALIEKLVAAGHSVSVGINPCLPEWLPHPENLTRAIAERGAYGAWIEPLHFNRKQLLAMGPKDQALMGEAVIERALKRKVPSDYAAFLDRVEESAIAAGLEVFSVDRPKPSQYWKPYREIYQKVFPTMTEFINHLVNSGTPERGLITIDQFLEFMLPYLPEGTLSLGHYIGSTAHQVCREHPNWSNWLSYKELLTMLWGDGRIKMSPVRNRAFSFACDRASDGKLVARFDQYGQPILIFSVQGFDSYQVEV